MKKVIRTLGFAIGSVMTVLGGLLFATDQWWFAQPACNMQPNATVEILGRFDCLEYTLGNFGTALADLLWQMHEFFWYRDLYHSSSVAILVLGIGLLVWLFLKPQITPQRVLFYAAACAVVGSLLYIATMPYFFHTLEKAMAQPYEGVAWVTNNPDYYSLNKYEKGQDLPYDVIQSDGTNLLNALFSVPLGATDLEFACGGGEGLKFIVQTSTERHIWQRDLQATCGYGYEGPYHLYYRVTTN